MHLMASPTWGEEERKAVLDVFDSGQWTMGKKVREFEEAYAGYVGTKYCVLMNSGSSANLAMVAAYTLRHGPGTVIVPSIAWSTSYSPFQQYGWKLVFVDVDRQTLNYDLVQLWNAVMAYDDPLVLAVNLLGNPNDYNAFPRKCHILEDNCESMGAEYETDNGWKKTGSFGRMSSHSTFFSHHMSTMEGGMVTTNDEHYYHMLLCLRAHGWTRNLPLDNALKVEPGQFSFIYPGYNFKPNEIQAALGLTQLKKLPEFIAQRRENAKRFPLETQKEIGKSSWFGFAVFGDDVVRVSKTCETRPVVAGNFTRSPSIKHYRHEIYGALKNADYVHDHSCFIGNHHYKVDWGFI